jgi:2-polyprenyl-6-methoxyphenol hydroxylase-like FAD-dependent oxidoreductase
MLMMAAEPQTCSIADPPFSNLNVTKFTLIGRGLAGGLLAAYWGRRGYDVDLYERRADSRAGNFVGGALINLSLSLFRNEQGHEDIRYEVAQKMRRDRDPKVSLVDVNTRKNRARQQRDHNPRPTLTVVRRREYQQRNSGRENSAAGQ